MFDQRCPLISGTQIQISEECIYQIIGEPIGFGGGSIIYPAQKLVPHNGSWASDGFEYVLKECYPASTDHWYMRNHSGEVVSRNASQGEDAYLAHIKQMMLDESSVSQMIYKTASRIIPIRDSASDIILSQPGKQCEQVHNTITIMDSLRLKGRALTYYIKEYGCLSPIQAFCITQQLLLALQEVHQAGYLHLDIQDGNVFIKGTLEDENNLVTLIDFGSARHMCDGKTEMIEDRMVFSTQGYSSPEILLHNDGTLQLGPEADIYSVGCMILHMLTGSRADPNSLLYNTSGEFLTKFNLRKINCPAHLVDRMQAIIAHALAREPENRYHSAEAMLEDVCDFVKALQPYRSDLSSVDYDAFICYKHGPTDSAVAHVLQQKLEHFRVPREKGKKKYPFERIFLDEGELSSCADLGEPIRAVLKNAGWLIVICSPDTPLSPWVRSEIDVFMEYHDRSRILAVLTGGEPEEAFPEQLLGGDKAGEVLAADARGRDVHEVLQKTKRDVILRIAAPMLGLPYDSLRQRRKIYAMKRFAVLTALALALVSAFSVYAVVQNVRIDEQYNAVRIRESRYLSEVAERALEEGDRTKAINIALLALPSAAQDRPYVPDAERVLTDALHAYEYDPDTTSHDYDMKLSMNDNITDMIICEDTYLCCVTEAHWIGVFNTTDGTCLWQRRLQEIVDDPSIDNDYAYDAIEDITYDTGTGNLIMTFRGHIICIDLKSGASVWTRELCDYGDIAYCLQGDLLYAFPYGKMISNNLIYCYSIADGVDKGVYPMNTSSIVTDGSEGACFVYAEIHVDEEHNAVIAATLHDEESTSKDDSEHCVVCAYNFQNMTTSILERTDDMLGFLPVGEDYYLASADYSSAERDRFKTNYNLLRITRITYDGIKLSFVWERQHKMSYPLAAWGYLHNGDSIHMWDGSDYIALGIGKDIISIAPEDGRKLDQYSGSSEIVSVQKSVRPIILNENGEIQEYVSYGNIWTRDHLNRVALKLVAGADYYAVLFQDQPQATYILRNLNDNWYSAVFHSSSMFAFSQEYLGSSDGSSILYISDPLGERRIGTLGRLIDMQTMDMVESWFFEGAQRKDILQLSADGNNVFWLCNGCLLQTNLSTAETVTLADGIDAKAAVVTAPYKKNQPSRMAILYCASHWDGEHHCYENEFRLQIFQDGILISEACHTMQTNDYNLQDPNSLCVGSNGYCIFKAKTDTGDALIVYNADQCAFEVYENLPVVDELCICLASEEPWYSYIDSDGVLKIQDIARKEIIMSLGGFVSGCSWIGFSSDDAYLFAVTNNAELIVIDVNNHRICSSSKLGSTSGYDRLNLLEGDGFYFLHAPARNEGYIISCPEMRIRAHLQNVLGFIPGQNSILISCGGTIGPTVALYPIHELNKMIDMGIETIRQLPLSEKECLESNIDYAFYTEVYEKWMQSIEAVSDWPIVNESKIIHISSNDSTEITVSAPAEKKAADETTTESIKADFFLVEQEDGSVLATWIDETPSREPYALTSYYGIFDWFSDEPQFHYSIADNLSGNEYRIEDLLPDTQYTIFLRMANGDAMGEYIRTRATPDYSKGDISFQRAMLQGGEGQDMQCADSWLLEDVQRQLASGDLHLVCSFDTTAACPAGEKKLLIRVTAPNGSVGEKGLSIDLQSDMRNQQIVMDFNIDVLLNMIDEKVAHIPTGAYIVDLYVDRQYLGSASFSINFSDM